MNQHGMNQHEAKDISDRLNSALGGPDCAQVVTIDGHHHLITDGTGEGVFAYLVDDHLEAAVAAAEAAVEQARAVATAEAAVTERHQYEAFCLAPPAVHPYEAFCRESNPVHDPHTATAVWRELDVRVCVPGCCEQAPLDGPALLDSEIVDLCAELRHRGGEDDAPWIGAELCRRIGERCIGAECRAHLLEALEEVTPS